VVEAGSSPATLSSMSRGTFEFAKSRPTAEGVRIAAIPAAAEIRAAAESIRLDDIGAPSTQKPAAASSKSHGRKRT